jgi:DNA repair exonuclease SbcCD ATPase subunit
MMIVKVETREFRLEQLIEDLEATCRDLTAAKRDLEQLNRTLEQRVESRTDQLREKNEDLRQSLEQLRREIKERQRLNIQLEEANRKLLDAYLFMKQSKDRLASRQYAESVVFLIDPEGRICGVTEKALELTGKNRSQLNTSQIDDLFASLEGRSVKDLLRQVQPRLPLRTSLRMRCTGEDERRFDAKFTRVAFEGKRFIYAVLYEAGEG